MTKIDPTKPLRIYNASAGSGKTYTLVQSYLDIVLNKKDPYVFRSILAMTFTNKAANEMKVRILDALIDLSTPSAEKTEKQLQFLTDTSKNLALDPYLIEERSKNILNKILHHYSSFSIMTLDKFTHKIIRTFAKDLGISLDFDVELDLTTLRKNITDMLFDSIGRDGENELTRIMLEYANDNLKEDKSWNFSSQLLQFSQYIFKEDAIQSIEKLTELSTEDFQQAKKNIISENQKIKAHIGRLATEAIDLIKSKGLDHDDFKSKSKGVYSYFKKIKAEKFDLPSKTIMGYAESDDWAHNKSANAGTVKSISDLITQYFNQIVDALEQELPKYSLNVSILKNFNNLSLLKHLMVAVEQLKQDENKLLISDFYKKIADIIMSEPVPFIYERLGTRFHHFLLDEFQDTSQLQWINLIPLLHNSIASGYKNLIVGDGKQAIYRWRNGEVEQFTQLPERIYNPTQIDSLKEAEYLFKEMGQKVSLDANYRSANEIVSFNNHLFEHLKHEISSQLQYIYDDAKQEVKKDHQGYVNTFFKADISEDDQLAYILEKIHLSIEKGYEYKDISIIVRNNKNGVLIANDLTQKGIPIISTESLQIGNDISVKFLNHLISSIIKPKDKNLKLKCLEHYAHLNAWDVTEYMVQKQEDIENKTLQHFFADEGFDIQLPHQFHNLYEFVESLIEIFDLNPTNNPFLQFFLESVHSFEIKTNSNTRDFIEWFNDKGMTESIMSPEGANAIRIMTIHKSKGLQFPVVICPFYDWKMDVSKEIIWVENQRPDLPAFFVNANKSIAGTDLDEAYQTEKAKFELDQLNLLYVAFTRAETALFISANVGKISNPSKNWLLPFVEQSDLFTPQGDEFEYGEFQSQTASKTTNEDIYGYDLTFLKQVMNKPKLSYKSGVEWEVNDLDSKREFGNQVHLLLSKVIEKEEWLDKLNEFIKKGWIEEAQKEAYKKYVDTLFKDPHFSAYFKPGLQIENEKEIIDNKGHKHIPDKVVFYDNQTLIVDFKTGQKTESHFKQVKTYIKLLREMGFPSSKR